MTLSYKPNDILITAEAAVHDNSCFINPVLKGYHCIDPENPNAEWDVQYGNGSFCFSFAIIKGEQLKCLRVWKNDNMRLRCLEHVKRVSDCFNRYRIDYVKGYSYIEQAIRLKNGVIIPAVLMDWVSGDTLIDYVKANYRNSTTICQLANNFLSMCQYHQKYSMAHGDLSAGNIIVQPNNKICLIDYDSFYFHEFGSSIPEYTKGTPGYQHHERLNRTGQHFIDQKTDYYSQLVIYLSLIAIAAAPQLFNPLLDECLLFQTGDMQSRESLLNSVIFKKLSSINNNEIKLLLGALVKAIDGPLSQVRSIVDIKNLSFKTSAVKIKARFCGLCGHEFGINNFTDDYCPQCSTEREKLSYI